MFDDGEHVVSYASRTLNKAERSYSTTEKELLAVLFAVEVFRPYIEGSHFSIYTDHHSFIWLNNLKEPTGRLGRWSLKLQQYDFDIFHRKGKENVVPDALSRSFAALDSLTVVINPFKTHTDKWYQDMIQKVSENPIKYPIWRVENEILYKKIQNNFGLNNNGDDWKIIVPKGFRSEILKQCHDDITSGHVGIYKTYHRILSKYFWPKMKSHVTRYVNRCSICLANKPEQKPPIGKMCSRPEVDKPWELVCVDLVGPLPKSSRGYRYILSVVDYFSKFPFFFPLRSMNAKNVISQLEDNLFMLMGVPKCIVSDNGKQFRGRSFKKLCQDYKIKHSFTALYHPQANAVERVHRVLKTMLASYAKDNHRTWDVNLQKVACAIRTSKSETTKFTPYFINFGREMNLNDDLTEMTVDVPDEVDIKVDDGKLANDRPRMFKEIFENVRTRMNEAMFRGKKNYDLRRRDTEFSVGQKVWRRNFAISDASKHITSKLNPKYLGPFIIHKKLSPWTYELKSDTGRSCGTYSAKDLKSHPPDEDDKTSVNF